MRFQTTTRATITADSLENAMNIAIQYDMGEIVCTLPDLPKPISKDETVRPGKFACMCDITNKIEFIGSFEEATKAAYQDNTTLVVVYYENNKPEKLTNFEERTVRHYWETEY